MKRVLSLLLLIPFLTVQAWALRGGPYDGLNGRSLSALAGMYGVVLTGNVLLNEKDEAVNPVNPETTGVMAMSIPGSGMASGRILIFAQGLMYLGNAQGIVDQRSSKITLVSQVSHYVARMATNGITRQSGIAVDAILSGQMNLALNLDYFTGLIEVAGGAKYFRYDPLLAEVKLDTNTSTAVNNAVSNQNKNVNQIDSESANATQTAVASQGTSTNTSEGKTLDQTAVSTTTNTVVGPDGSTTSNTDSTSSTSNNLSGSTTNTNALSTDTRNSDLSKGTTVTAGTAMTSGTTQNATNTVTTTKYDIAAVRQRPIASAFMSLAVIGVRQDVTAVPIAPFTPPTEATSFQIEVAAPTTGGETGGAVTQPGA
jgi:hypothetical protein